MMLSWLDSGYAPVGAVVRVMLGFEGVTGEVKNQFFSNVLVVQDSYVEYCFR